MPGFPVAQGRLIQKGEGLLSGIFSKGLPFLVNLFKKSAPLLRSSAVKLGKAAYHNKDLRKFAQQTQEKLLEEGGTLAGRLLSGREGEKTSSDIDNGRRRITEALSQSPEVNLQAPNVLPKRTVLKRTNNSAKLVRKGTSQPTVKKKRKVTRRNNKSLI